VTVSGHQRQTATGKTILDALSIRLQDRAALRRPNPRSEGVTLMAPLHSSLSEQRFPLYCILFWYEYLLFINELMEPVSLYVNCT
jgi:hypothetical protein